MVEHEKEAGFPLEDVDEMASRLTQWVTKAVGAPCPRLAQAYDMHIRKYSSRCALGCVA
jgi:hypothetical protein